MTNFDPLLYTATALKALDDVTFLQRASQLQAHNNGCHNLVEQGETLKALEFLKVEGARRPHLGFTTSYQMMGSSPESDLLDIMKGYRETIIHPLSDFDFMMFGLCMQGRIAGGDPVAYVGLEAWKAEVAEFRPHLALP